MELASLLVSQACGHKCTSWFLKTKALQSAVAGMLDTWSDLSTGIIFLENGHTAWATITFTTFGE